jgi:hypothetical protein
MAITNDLPCGFCWVSQTAITSRLATVSWWRSGMASGFISSLNQEFHQQDSKMNNNAKLPGFRAVLSKKHKR